MAKTEEERREVYYSGRVQGVGFRYLTRSIAERFAVTGSVKNLPDGRVRVVVEGQPAEVRAFLQEVQSVLSRYIREVHQTSCPATGRYESFDIEY